MAGSLRMVLCLAAVGGELSGAAAHLLWEKASRQGRLRQQLKRLTDAGRIVTEGEGRIDRRVVRLTAEGRFLAQAGIDPPALWSRAWDRRWRIVAFDIPESATALRTRLRRRLHEHRFGWLQNSVWLSPDRIDEFRAQLEERQTVPECLTFLEAAPIGGESSEAMVLAAWDFEALAKSYKDYLGILRLRPGRERDVESWLGWLQTEHQAWRQIARRDPFLPQELLPAGYLGQEAWAARQAAFGEFAAVLSAQLKR